MSKTESHISARTSRRGPASVIRTDYMSQDEEPTPTFMYPHLQVIDYIIYNTSINQEAHFMNGDIMLFGYLAISYHFIITVVILNKFQIFKYYSLL